MRPRSHEPLGWVCNSLCAICMQVPSPQCGSAPHVTDMNLTECSAPSTRAPLPPAPETHNEKARQERQRSNNFHSKADLGPSSCWVPDGKHDAPAPRTLHLLLGADVHAAVGTSFGILPVPADLCLTPQLWNLTPAHDVTALCSHPALCPGG